MKKPPGPDTELGMSLWKLSKKVRFVQSVPLNSDLHPGTSMGSVSVSDEKHSTFAFSESELAKKAPKAGPHDN